jgi:hypothetical protein
VLVGVLAGLVLLNVSVLGAGGWAFQPGPVRPTGLFAPLVRAAHERWDLGLLRSAAVLGGVLAACLALVVFATRGLRVWLAIASAVTITLLLVVPAVSLQAGLRQSTAPWFYTNDSTYQIELAGSLLRSGSNPYGHDYERSGLVRFYSLNGTAPLPNAQRQVALRHFAYFPGTAVTAAVWGLLPRPVSDYRFLVALCALALLPAALVFPGPLGVRLALGAVLAANPLIVQAVWFGTADAPSLLALVAAFGLATRRRFTAAAGLLGAAVVFKQFALVAIPFLGVMLLVQPKPRDLVRPASSFLAVVLAGLLPFLVTNPAAFWSDTVKYGAGTYPIIGYGLASLLVRAHIVARRTSYYPFLPIVALVWLPVSVWLAWLQSRSRATWTAAAAFSISIFLLLFVARVFQTSYLIWPLVGAVLALLQAGADAQLGRVSSAGAAAGG